MQCNLKLLIGLYNYDMIIMVWCVIQLFQRASEQYLIAHTIAVEKVGAIRKLRHIFLFKNILVCARQCVSGR